MASGGWASRLALRIRTALLSSGQCTAEKKQAVLNLWVFSSGRHGTGLQQDMEHRKGTLALVDARQGWAKRDRLFPHRSRERNSRGRSGKPFEIFCPSKELKRWPSSSPLTRFTGIKNGIASNHNHPIWGLGTQPNGTLTGHSRSHPAREPEFFPPRPVSISPGHLQQDDCGAAVVLFTSSPECIVGRGHGRSGGGCRIRQGVLLLATDTTPTPRVGRGCCKGQSRRRSTSTTKLLLHFVAPGHVPGRASGRAVQFLSSLRSSLFSFLPFLQSLSYLRLACRSTRPHTIPRSLAPLCFASSCWNSGSPCEREPHPRSWVGIVGKKKIQEYEIAKLVTWWLLLCSLPLVTPRPEPAPLSEANRRRPPPPKTRRPPTHQPPTAPSRVNHQGNPDPMNRWR